MVPEGEWWRFAALDRRGVFRGMVFPAGARFVSPKSLNISFGARSIGLGIGLSPLRCYAITEIAKLIGPAGGRGVGTGPNGVPGVLITQGGPMATVETQLVREPVAGEDRAVMGRVILGGGEKTIQFGGSL